MSTNDEKAQKIADILKDGLNKDDFTNSFKNVVQYVMNAKATLTDLFARKFDELSAKIDARIAAIKDGYTPVKGVDYDDGKDGYTPVKGKDYFDGETPIKGIHYFDGAPGQDAPVLLGEDYRNALETLQGEDRLDASAIRNLPEVVKNEARLIGGRGGPGGLQLLVGGSNKKTAKYLNLIAGANITLTWAYSNGRNDVTITAGAGVLSILTATGVVNDSNVNFTFVSQPTIVIVNGTSYRLNNGWSWNAGTLTATLDNPPGVGGDIYGL